MRWLSNWNPTTALALWGAIVGTGTAIWTIKKDLLDRSSIRVVARLRCIGNRDGDGAPYSATPSMNIDGLDDKLYILMSVTNVGRRKMKWNGWGGKYREPVNGKGGFIVSPRSLPKTLDEQEHHDEWTDLDQQFVTGNVKSLYAWDVAGREWFVSKKHMKALKADIDRFADVADRANEHP